jgi:hypothetical protein
MFFLLMAVLFVALQAGFDVGQAPRRPHRRQSQPLRAGSPAVGHGRAARTTSGVMKHGRSSPWLCNTAYHWQPEKSLFLPGKLRACGP